MIWFTSDTHFGHATVVKYCSRPFSSVYEMNAKLEANWNSAVVEGDTVYHLGDFSFLRKSEQEAQLRGLAGNIFFLRGNHDRKFPFGSSAITFLGDYYELKVPDEEMDLEQLIVLCHYPLQVWNKKHYGAWHLHGHCHSSLPSSDHQARLDVGVDSIARFLAARRIAPGGQPLEGQDYRPISYEEVRQIMTAKVFKPEGP